MQNQEKKLGVTERSFPQNRLEFPTFQPGSPKISTLTRFRESYFISKGFLKNCLRFTKYVLRFLNNFPAPSSYYQPGPGQSRHNVTCTLSLYLYLYLQSLYLYLCGHRARCCFPYRLLHACMMIPAKFLMSRDQCLEKTTDIS